MEYDRYPFASLPDISRLPHEIAFLVDVLVVLEADRRDMFRRITEFFEPEQRKLLLRRRLEIERFIDESWNDREGTIDRRSAWTDKSDACLDIGEEGSPTGVSKRALSLHFETQLQLRLQLRLQLQLQLQLQPYDCISSRTSCPPLNSALTATHARVGESQILRYLRGHRRCWSMRQSSRSGRNGTGPHTRFSGKASVARDGRTFPVDDCQRLRTEQVNVLQWTVFVKMTR